LPDHRTLAGTSIASNSVAFIDTATNVVKDVTYLGRSPHEPFFTPDGSDTGLQPRASYRLAFSHRKDGGGRVEPLAAFETNFSGSAIVNAVGQIRQVARPQDAAQRRYLVIVRGTGPKYGAPVQLQSR
jgi:hypothetical protein